MLSVKAREATVTIFGDFGMTLLRIKPSLPCFVGERSPLGENCWQVIRKKRMVAAPNYAKMRHFLLA